jgi:hypothetical protein
VDCSSVARSRPDIDLAKTERFDYSRGLKLDVPHVVNRVLLRESTLQDKAQGILRGARRRPERHCGLRFQLDLSVWNLVPTGRDRRTREIWDKADTRPAVRSNFDKVMKCRTEALGSEVYASSI